MPRETVRLPIVNKNVWQAENTLPLFPLTTGLATQRVASLKEREKSQWKLQNRAGEKILQIYVPDVGKVCASEREQAFQCRAHSQQFFGYNYKARCPRPKDSL